MRQTSTIGTGKKERERRSFIPVHFSRWYTYRRFHVANDSSLLITIHFLLLLTPQFTAFGERYHYVHSLLSKVSQRMSSALSANELELATE